MVQILTAEEKEGGKLYPQMDRQAGGEEVEEGVQPT